MSTADVIRLSLCHRGDIIHKGLTYIQYFGPVVVQAALWGLSLQKRDAFLFLTTNFYTIGMYYLLLAIRDGFVRSARPFFVKDCDRSFAVPDVWMVVTASLVFTLLACALIYRKRTFWRVISIVLLSVGVCTYLAASLVNGYLFLWQWLVNVAVILVLVLLVNLFIWMFVVDFVDWLMRWDFMGTLGFDMCFLAEWKQTRENLKKTGALKQLSSRRTNWLSVPHKPSK